MKKGLCAICLILIPEIALATQAGFWTKIAAVMSFDGVYGGCHAYIVTPTSDSPAGLNCPSANYVSFNCDGLQGWNTKAAGSIKLGNAQLAMITKASAFVVVDDTKIFNQEMCLATSVQVSIPQ